MFHSSNPSLFGRPGGVLDEARALESSMDAGFGSRVTELEVAHEGLRKSVSSARKRASTSSDTDGVGLTRHIADIIRRFEAHEVLEQELLQDFFLA